MKILEIKNPRGSWSKEHVKRILGADISDSFIEVVQWKSGKSVSVMFGTLHDSGWSASHLTLDSESAKALCGILEKIFKFRAEKGAKR